MPTQVYPIESYHVEVTPLARPQGMRRYQATATRPGHTPIAAEGYSVAEVLMRVRLRLCAPEETAQPETAQPETAQPETAKPRKAKAVKTRKKTQEEGQKAERKIGRSAQGADGRYVSKNGLPPGTTLSAPVYFARGAHPAPRLWYRTRDGSTAPYTPR